MSPKTTPKAANIKTILRGEGLEAVLVWLMMICLLNRCLVYLKKSIQEPEFRIQNLKINNLENSYTSPFWRIVWKIKFFLFIILTPDFWILTAEFSPSLLKSWHVLQGLEKITLCLAERRKKRKRGSHKGSKARRFLLYDLFYIILRKLFKLRCYWIISDLKNEF